MRRPMIPVTVLTGFLGSGKTTLLNRILKEQHGQRYAVIENEYGEAGIDAELILRSGNETIVELANGCVCCTVRGDLAIALAQLAAQRASGEIAFDRVLIETTGLADPGPIIQTFLAGTEVDAVYELDGVVTLVDAAHIASQVDCVEVRAQIACADCVLLTKTDLCDAATIAQAESLIDSLSLDPLMIAKLDVNRLDLAALDRTLFGIRGYQTNLVRFASFAVPAGTRAAPAAQMPMAPLPARHTRDVVSFVYRSARPLDAERFELCIEDAQQRYGRDLWRFKGTLSIDQLRHRLVVQGVQGLLQMNPGGSWQPFDQRGSVLVFIGRLLDAEAMLAALAACEVGEA
ncbi:MAG: GTPase [Nevskia sp.]